MPAAIPTLQVPYSLIYYYTEPSGLFCRASPAMFIIINTGLNNLAAKRDSSVACYVNAGKC
jgi:hypothetical protein